MFKADTKSVKKFALNAKNAPRFQQAVSARLLNRMAGDLKLVSSQYLRDHTIARNKTFIESQIRVSLARGGPIDSQRAVVYTQSKGKFDGFLSQETGAGTPRTHVASLLARAGAVEGGIVRQINRLKPGVEIPDADTFPGQTPKLRIIAMLVRFNLTGYRGLFKANMPKAGPAIYTTTNRPYKATKNRRGSKLRFTVFARVASLRRGPQPKRVLRWMERSKIKYLTGVDYNRLRSSAMQDMIARWSK